MTAELIIAVLALSAAPDDCGHGSVFFDRGAPTTISAKVTATQEKALHCNLDWLHKFPGLNLTIIPRVSPRECDKDCFALSKRRAQLVQNWFVAHGIERKRVDIFEAAASAAELDDNERNLPRDEFARRVEFFPHD